MTRDHPTTPRFVRPPHPATLDDEELLAQCALTKGRASGPGGQHRNKVETLVTLSHEPTGVEAHAGERRSVMENRRVALFRLRLRLAVDVRTPVPAGDARSALWRSRSEGSGRIACNPEHRDYPSMLAEALDMAAACGWNVRKAASRLSCTPSQLLKLVKEHPPAWVWLNEGRASAGERPLK